MHILYRKDSLASIISSVETLNVYLISFLVRAQASIGATLASHLYTKSAMYYWHRNPQCSLPPPTPYVRSLVRNRTGICAYMHARIHMRTYIYIYIYVWALVPGGKLRTGRLPFLVLFCDHDCHTKCRVKCGHYASRRLTRRASIFLIGERLAVRKRNFVSRALKSLKNSTYLHAVSSPFLAFTS